MTCRHDVSMQTDLTVSDHPQTTQLGTLSQSIMPRDVLSWHAAFLKSRSDGSVDILLKGC